MLVSTALGSAWKITSWLVIVTCSFRMPESFT